MPLITKPKLGANHTGLAAGLHLPLGLATLFAGIKSMPSSQLATGGLVVRLSFISHLPYNLQ